jgi:3-oxoacyl-[acyl-carrier protein] reductase
VHLTRTMAATLAPRKIRVNAVAPGAVDTEGMRANGDRLEQSRARAPFARVADPAEIADLVWWLVTGEGAQYITGETIVASGGLVMR